MATCGINVSMSSLQGELTSKISGFLDLKGSLGTLGGISSLTSILPSGLAGIKGKVTGMIPEIPLSTSGFSSLRNDLNSVVQSAGGGLGDFLSKYAGLKDFSGFANFDLNNLANSAFSLGANFDPCSIDLPKIFADADGALSKGAQSPSIGATEAAGTGNMISQEVSNIFGTIAGGNLPVVPAFDSITGFTDIASIQKIVDGGSGTFPNFDLKSVADGAIRSLPSGEKIFQDRSGWLNDSLKEALGTGTKPGVLMDEETQNYTFV